jgi:hypothetical protein
MPTWRASSQAQAQHGASPIKWVVLARRAMMGHSVMPACVPNQEAVKNPSKF